MASRTRLLALVKALRWQDVKAALEQSPGLLKIRDAKGRNWLHLCCGVSIAGARVRSVDSVRTAETLLEVGIDVNEPAFVEGDWKATPLWYAIAQGDNVPLARFLLDHGSEPHHCLWAAVNRDNPAAIRLLFERGADDPTGEETSPLQAAVRWNKLRAAEELLKLGAEVDHQDLAGMTPLHHALEKGRDRRWIRLLLEHGARSDLRDQSGATAADLMMRKRDPEIREIGRGLVRG